MECEMKIDRSKEFGKFGSLCRGCGCEEVILNFQNPFDVREQPEASDYWVRK